MKRVFGIIALTITLMTLSSSAMAITLYHNAPTPTLDVWNTSSILLQESGWVVDNYSSGQAATETEFKWVLGNLSGLYLLTEWRTGPDDTNVDNIRFGPAVSTFDSSNEGWFVTDPDPLLDLYGLSLSSSPLGWDPSLGNAPSGPGSVRVGDVYYWTWIGAPGYFLGDQSALYGGYLSRDILIRYTDDERYPELAFVAPDVPEGWSPGGNTVVPEPASLSLLGLGLLGLLGFKKRK